MTAQGPTPRAESPTPDSSPPVSPAFSTSVSASSRIRTAVSAWCLRQHQRRRQPDRVLAGAEHQQAAVERRVHDGVALLDRRAPWSCRSCTHSMPIIRPLPRTSPMSGCLSISVASALEQMGAHRLGVLASARAASRSIVARAAAHDTGLPPKVLACAPGGHDMTSARAVHTPSGMPDAMPLARRDDVGLDAEVLDREHLPGAAHARLHLVGDEQHAVLAWSARAAARWNTAGGTT